MKFILPLLCVLVTGAFAQTGQNTNSGSNKSTTDTEVPTHFWQATLPGGEYLVALSRITAVSHHTYLLNGGIIVNEVTVDTDGQSLARFYYLAPVTDATNSTTASNLADRGKQLLDMANERVGGDLNTMVVKKYPETTHARTVEYRLLDEKDLLALYGSVSSAWQSGRGRKFTVK